MAVSRMSIIWGLLAARAAGTDGPPTAADVCAVCVLRAAVSGAAVSATGKAGTGDPGTGHVICVTDSVGEQVEELQLTLGEGPRVDALAAGAPVLVPDLGAADIGCRWPGFSPAARLAGAAAVFALPLQIGAIRVGVLDLYRRDPGPLSADQLRDALLLADAATVLLLEGQDRPEGRDGRAGDGQQAGAGAADAAGPHGDGRRPGDGRARPGPGGQPLDLGQRRAEIDQATGMLTEQLGVSIDEAFIRLRAYAYAHDRRLVDVARDLVARTLWLGSGDPPAGGAT